MKMDDDLLDLPITTRCICALQRNGIQNLAELTKMTKSDLLKLPTIGKKCLEEIVEVLAEIGLSLSPGPEDKKEWDELGKRIDKQLKGFLAMKEDTTIIDPTWMSKTGGFARDMTMRDHFAGLAMQYMGLPTRVHATGRIGDNSWSLEEMKKGFPYEDMSTVAYKWADAMLKARDGK